MTNKEALKILTKSCFNDNPAKYIEAVHRATKALKIVIKMQDRGWQQPQEQEEKC